MQPVRREADRYESRVAYEMTEWRKKSPARVLDSTAGQAKRAWAGGHELSALNTKTRPHAILFNKIAVMSSGACNLASCSSAALLDTRHALVADPEPFARLVVSNSPQRARVVVIFRASIEMS
jgi:hypothetical protein